jgi:hypothetical protein
MSSFKITLISIVWIVLYTSEQIPTCALSQDDSEVFPMAVLPVNEPLEKSKLTKRILRKHRWQEEAPIPNCVQHMEFGARGHGNAYGCGLLGTLEFKYSLQKDTLYIEQYRVFDAKGVPEKWMGGKYIYTGNSLILVKATEWDSSGKATDVFIARKHEFKMR